MKLIEILVSPIGQSRVETKGFAGADCRQASEFLEAALGRKTGERPTAEFYQQTTQQSSVQEGT